jgi:hypothetical protein
MNENEKELGITDQEMEEKSRDTHQPQKPSPAGQAYRLFSQGQTPLDVAAELNIREVEVTRYYREHWKLKGLYRFNQIYEDVKNDIIHIIRLHKRMKASRIGIEEVINLIKIANYGLPVVEDKYRRLKRDVNSLESRKFNEYRTLHQVQGQIADSKRKLEWLHTMIQEEEDNINQLYEERIRLKRLVRLFKDNYEEYLKIKKIVEDQVSRVLLDSMGFLRLAFYSLIKSMRKDPEKYSALVHYANNGTSYGDSYNTSSFGDPQFNSYDPFFKALESTILEDANKLYERLLKEQVNTIITDFASDKNASLSSTAPLQTDNPSIKAKM